MASGHGGKAVVIMGVCGAGKSTTGEMLANVFNCDFIDADDFHRNRTKMRQGIPLSEEDRIPWLEVIRGALMEVLTSGKTGVLACSSLQKQYREILRSADPNYQYGSYACSVMFVLLDASVEVLSERLNRRAAEGKHFMPANLLQSQLELLQIDECEGILKVDATLNPQEIVKSIQEFLSRSL